MTYRTLVAFVTALALLAVPSSVVLASETAVVAQGDGTRQGELAPRYQPAPVQEKSGYNSDYIFSLTRGVADSTLHPAAKAPMFLFTIPLDITLLPVTTLVGLFG